MPEDYSVPNVIRMRSTHPLIDLKVTKLDSSVQIPAFAYEGDAGLDIRCSERVLLGVGERKLVSTGIAVAIPEGFVGLLVPRSGLSNKYGLSLVNSPGIIDSGYRGELKGILINEGQLPISFEAGERVMQLVIVPIPWVRVVEVESFDGTERGEGGFGSSGTE